jgi:predicted transcriptional regulator
MSDLEYSIATPEGDWKRLLIEVKSDPTHRVSLLRSAHKPVTTIPSATSVGTAFTLMMNFNYSQLPVMDNDRYVEGIFSWRSHGKQVASGNHCQFVNQAMEPAAIVDLDESIFEAFAKAAKYDYVLVRDHEKKICGIVTTYDVSEVFAKLAEPFLLLEEIEKRVRVLLDGFVSQDELKSVNDRRASPSELSLSNLSFGGYVKLFERVEVWERLGLNLDQPTFAKLLDHVREIRNEVMHFRPMGLQEQDLEALRNFTRFLRDIRARRSS